MRTADNEKESRLVSVVPSDRQLSLMQREFYAFAHFTVNTYTNREWGDGTEKESIFDPVKFDARQWVKAVKAAGMKGIILTCKHHDGFCLWPSKYTDHTVAGSPFKGDVVKEVSDACHEGGIGFGVYLSPWDRNSKLYGQSKAYDDYFVNQLEELLSNYGEVFSVWFDGACGEGPNGKKQYYDWNRYYETIRRLQPGACIHVCGPDVRWCGNEAGHTRVSEWSVVPERTRDTEKIASDSQQSDDTSFREREIKASDEDLGSYGLICDEDKLVWYPAEVDTSIRPGWFYHSEEDGDVKTPEELFDLYETTVGGNTTLLLNIPPTREGLFHSKDVEALEALGRMIGETYRDNLLERAKLSSDTDDGVHDVSGIRKDDYDTWYGTSDYTRTARITATFDKEYTLNRVVLKENVKLSQRIEGFRVIAYRGGREVFVYEGTVVGYKKIVRIPAVAADRIEIEVLDSRVAPAISFVGVY
ncbi:MAG: alpha-L-fucosidase [Lachnospiraceae bacterium]|nr:alpha-L-fucosidase [Lachnospiraceae bacterium]